VKVSRATHDRQGVQLFVPENEVFAKDDTETKIGSEEHKGYKQMKVGSHDGDTMTLLCYASRHEELLKLLF